MSDHCPTCGAEVRVVGRTTLHYEVVAPPSLTDEQREQIVTLRIRELPPENDCLDIALARLDHLEAVSTISNRDV